MCNPFKFVEDVINDIADVFSDAVSWIVDEVVDPVMETVGKVVDGMMSDPLATIAKVAAVATQQYWALPLIEGASVAAHGGDLGDVLEATAKAYVMQEVSQYVGKAAGQWAGETAAGAEYTANEAAKTATQKLAENVVGSAAGSAAVAVVAGQDPLEALVRGGLSAGTSALLGNVDGFAKFAKDNPVAANTISAAVTSALAGQNPSTAVVNSLLASTGIVTDIIKNSGMSLDKAQTAIVTDVLMGTMSAALTGGNPSNAVRAALMKAGSKALGEMVTDTFKAAASKTTRAYETADATASQITANEAEQTRVVADYNNINAQLKIRIDEQNRLTGLANAARDTYNNNKTQANYDAAIAAKNTAEAYISALNKDYAEFFRPNLTAYSNELNALKNQHSTLDTTYQDAVRAFGNATDRLTAALDPVYFSSDRAIVEAMDPNFNADQYRKLNGLGADVNVYDHYLGVGQFQNAPTNDKAAEGLIGAERTRLVNEALAAKGVNLATADPAEVSKILDNLDTKYGNNVAALRAATAQDVLSGNTTTIDKMAQDQKDGVFRVEVVGQSYGDWKKPKGFTPPTGLRLATLDEMEGGKATVQYTDDGRPVWMMEDKSTAVQHWDPTASDYSNTLPEVVITAKRPDRSQVYNAYADVETDKTFANLFRTVGSVIATGAGEQLQNWSSAYALQFGGNMNNMGYQLGTMLSQWGKDNSPADIKAQMTAVKNGLDAAAKKGSWWEQQAAVLDVLKSNPSAYFAYVGQELTQEVVPTGAGLITAALTTALSGNPVAGISAGTLVATTIEGIETMGSTGREVYNNLINQGYREEDARSRALLAGYSAAAITAPSNAIANAAVMVPYLKGLGAGANVALQGLRGVAADAAGEYIETYAQTVVTQVASNQPVDLAAANTQATFAMAVSAGTTGTMLSPAIVDGSMQIGKDVFGNALTWEGLTTGTQLADVRTLDGNLVLGRTEDGKNITLASAVYDGRTSDTGQELSADVAPSEAFNQWFDPYEYSVEEVKADAAEAGFQLSDEQAQQYVQQGDEATLSKSLGTRIAVQQAVDNALGNITLPSGTTKADVTAAISDYMKANPGLSLTDVTAKIADMTKGLATKADIETAIANIKFPAGISKDDVTAAITAYMKDNPGLSLADVATKIADATKGLATTEGTKTAISDALKGYATKSDIETAIKDIKFPAGISKDDVTAAITAYMKDNPGLSLADVATKIADATKGLATTEGTKTAIADALKDYATSKDIESVQKAVLDKVAEYEKAGITRDEALAKSVEAVAADLGTTKDDILAQIGAPASVDEDGNPVAATGVYAALATGLADVQKAVLDKVAEYEAAGITRDEALAKAVDDVAAELGTTKDDILGQIGAPASVDADGNPVAATGVYAALATGLADVQKTVLDKVAEYEAAGLTRDQALAKAVEDVSTSVGKTKEEVMSQIGAPASVDADGNPVAATGVYAALETATADVQKTVLAKMAEYEKAGLTRDQALAKSVEDVATGLGKTKEDILGQIGTPASVDEDGNPVAATGIYAALETGLSNVQTDIGTVKKDVENLAADVQTKYDSLTQSQKDLTDLLTQQGIDINTAITAVKTDTAAGFKDVFTQMSTNQAATQRAIDDAAAATRAQNAAEAERTRQANARNAANVAKLGNINTLMGMLGQAQDVGGQQVTVKQADPAKIGYIYDWNSIFANPSQEKMFASPYGAYAKGGVVRSEMDEVNDELLKLLRG